MLNRRIIRVKALQALYARYLLSAAEKQVAYEQFLDKIQMLPSYYNENNESRKSILSSLRAKSSLYFQHMIPAEPDTFPAWICEQLNASVAELQATLQKVDNKSINEMVSSLHAAWSLFGAILAFITELSAFVWVDEHEKRNRHLNKEFSEPYQLKFAENPIVKSLMADQAFQKNLVQCRYHFYKDSELIRKTFKEVLHTMPQYLEYREKPTATAEDELELLRAIFKKLMKYELLNDTLSEEDINWSENKILIEVLAKNFFRKANDGKAFESQYQTFVQEIDEDRDFLIQLYRKSIENSEKFDDLIKKTVQNWDINRIATTDYLILHLAMAEMVHFPHIPVKVTINEYLEVSKAYSTPASSTFLNGILDKIADMLQKMNMIIKSARGLMDNK